ncbi:Mss4-like protein [Mycena rosella]|uniref:Mss4-like protein n=1 Tax=Mycena rosella TaxID=1033263 RepID=A0AAD7G884_MYCRO|nr:Mss4-like protein [Mycena rosella]
MPTTVTGGCLCEGVRYQIDFAPDHDWENTPNTCQCTQCRKMTGSLVGIFHTVKTTELTWLAKATYAEYASSPGCRRAFCRTCGSSIGFIDLAVEGEIELTVGGFDERFLVGARDARDRPLGAWGVALARPRGHFYVRNEIEGVTDGGGRKGQRFWKGSKEGPMDEDKLS